jgi:GMP synthase (glutamine-hydrolysing)
MTRVKSEVLVSAALRCASASLIDCVLARRGDPDAGAIFVHIDALDGRHKLLARSLNFDSEYEWHIITNTEWVDATTASTRIAAEMKMDQDAFIVAVCDVEARNPFDALQFA